MIIEIKNHSELLEFIKRDNVPARAAAEIICKTLGVFMLFELSKENLIKELQKYIEIWSGKEVKPLFFGQTKLDFDITEIYKIMDFD
jgi:hypothetical protein